MASLEAALGLWADIDQQAVAAKSAALFDILHAAGTAAGLECVSPTDPQKRGSHISFPRPHAYELTQALIARGVIGDFRAPDVLRLGLTPLYSAMRTCGRRAKRSDRSSPTKAGAIPPTPSANGVT